jgi:tetratricopeptide (TPR) repeat protein
MKMRMNKIYLTVSILFIIPVVCFAADLETLKADFLQGNYRRVIFEGQAQLERINLSNTDELNYILGLSYLKEGKLDFAQNCFRKILSNQKSKFNGQASLALADTYLVSGQFQKAEESYKALSAQQDKTAFQAALLYRLSQLEFKRGNSQLGNEYLLKLRRDFPLSPELRLDRGIQIINQPPADQSISDSGEYCVQVGFFESLSNANRLKDELSMKNFSSPYIESSSGGYRIKVGRFKTQREAIDLASQLSKEGFQTKVCP